MIRQLVGPVALAALLCGCTGSGGTELATTRSITTGSTTGSAAPPPHAPTIPAQATQHSASGAQAYLAHYYDTSNWALATGDTRPLLGLASNACDECHAFDQEVTMLALFHSDTHGGRIRVLSSEVVDGQGTGAEVRLQANVEREARIVTTSGGIPIGNTPATTSVVVAHLEWLGSGWQILELSSA
jgi:hypothetical protein